MESPEGDKEVPPSTAKIRPMILPDLARIFPCVGKSVWEASEAEVEHWKAVYPTVDVEDQLLRIRVWLKESLGGRKLPRAMPLFIASWLQWVANDSRPSS